MPTLKLRFPGGRYHATPWGHHVNEGLIEWPPSPWRLLRTLIACGFSRHEWTDIPSVAQGLIGKLAGVLPLYRLPETSAAHSRHFMPCIEGKKQNTTLVFDTWANIGDGEVLIHWPCELNDDENALIGRLADTLGYLGRSESWVEGEFVAANPALPPDFNAFPCRKGTHPGREFEQVSLMAAVPPDEYSIWRQQMTKPILDAIRAPEGARKPTAKQLEKLQLQRAQATTSYPADLLSCLTKDTAWWKDYGWSQPPGSQWVLYWRPGDSLQVGVPITAKARHLSPITTMLLSLTTASGSKSALPYCARTLPQAELFHRAAVGRVGNGHRVHCPELTGKDSQGGPLRHDHRHAHIIPIDLDADSRLDHIIVYAEMGLNDAAQRAIRTLRRTWTKGGAGDIQVAVAGRGGLRLLRQLPQPLYHCAQQFLGPPHGSRVWVSATPFVPPRFLKARGKNTLVGQINAELKSRRLPEVADVHVDADLTRDLRHYVRRRSRRGTSPPIDAGYGLRLVFAEPIPGPLMLGYASHYGLGRFNAESSGSAPTANAIT